MPPQFVRATSPVEPLAQAPTLGLRQNWRQFSLLMLVNAFVGAMVGLERAVLPLWAARDFGLASNRAILSFIVAFGIVKAVTNLVAGRQSERVGRKSLLVAGWIAGLPIPFMLLWAPSWGWVTIANMLLGINQGLCWSTTVVMKIDLVGPRRRGLAMGLNEFAGYGAVEQYAEQLNEEAGQVKITIRQPSSPSRTCGCLRSCRHAPATSESLEQQTATSEVLQVISSSAGELKPVFETMLESAVRICGAKFGNLLLVEGDAFRHVALHGAPQAYLEERRREPVIRPRPGSDLDRIRSTKQIVHVADMQLEGPATAAIVELAGARTFLNVPMLKDNELIGTIGIYRQEVRPFTDKQIELVQNFAAQAVIAIENARLLNDLNKLNQQLEQRVADQVSEIERMGRLRRFLPPQVADLIVASGTEKQLESHRREITALFCDLRGFTGFSESSDPEDVMALLREYHAAIGEIINKYGGTLERYAGDGVMVVFNDPIPVDNPALQAVLMAIDMRAAIGELIEKWRKLGHDIGFGIGIAHGFATLGTIGFEGRFDYAAIGTVSNVASRLCDEAKPGQILISPRVLMAVEGAISVEPVGEFKLKGISRPLATYNVLSAVSAKI